MLATKVRFYGTEVFAVGEDRFKGQPDAGMSNVGIM
jgi:hypothetical protein